MNNKDIVKHFYEVIVSENPLNELLQYRLGNVSEIYNEDCSTICRR